MADDKESENMAKVDLIILQQLIKEIEDAKTSCNDAMNNIMSKLLELLDTPANLYLNTTGEDKPKIKSDDTFAVLYIVCVLMFFAASLVVVLIKYLMRERESVRLEAFYNNYLQKQPPKTVLYDRHGKRLSDPDVEIWPEEDGLCEVKDSPSTEYEKDIVNDSHFALKMMPETHSINKLRSSSLDSPPLKLHK